METPPQTARRSARLIAAALVLAAALAVAALVFLRGGSHFYLVDFANTGQLVKGDLVRIGGTKVGTVGGIELTASNQARVHVSVDDRYAPLHDGTTATIRSPGLVAAASRYVDLSPGSEVNPVIDDGGVIGSEKTTSIVEIDQLFATLDPKTRKGLQNLIAGSASWYAGQEANANASAQAFPAALSGLTKLADEITRDDATFQQFLVETGDALAPLADRSAQLTELVSNSRATAAAIGSDTQALSTTLRAVPPALQSGSEALAALRPALTDLRRLVDVTGPATRDLAPFLRQLRPVTEEAVPVFRQLRTMFAQPGAGNDLLDALHDLPAIDRLTSTGFPNAERALHDSTPVFSFVRPYTPDLVSWARNFGESMATYDANGHYARTVGVFDAFSYIDDANGGRLEPKAPAERGRSPYVSTGNLRRCPGASGVAPADGSAPWVDAGPLANPQCELTQGVAP